MASATPRSSDSTPGYAAGVSMKMTIGPVELLRQFHDPKRLAIALRTGVAEVAKDLLLGVAALLVTEHGDRLALVLREAADDGVVVGETAIAVQLVEPGEQAFDIVEGVRPAEWRATSTRCHGVRLA